MMTLVKPFGEIGLSHRDAVGGKGANLGELTRAGIPVPPGFVVTTGCFERFLDAVDCDFSLRRAIEALNADDLDAIGKAAGRVRDHIETCDLPADLSNAVALACAALTDAWRHPVAVRSSATAEDGDEASFAGLQDTYLWLLGAPAVVEHVRRCWASLYSVESVAYRRRLKMREAGLSMGVVVQRMVDARCSGVMFTRSPATGDRSVIVIEAGYGLGSAIVSGEVTPDKYVVSKVTAEVTHRAVSEKHIQHVPDRSAGGVVEEAVPAAQQTQPCLADAEIVNLAKMARRIEAHYGKPQDIEWAIARDTGELFLLQSRPETVWSKRDAVPVARRAADPLEHVFAVFGGNRKP